MLLWSITLTQESSTVTKLGLDALLTAFSRAGTLPDSNQILHSPLLANISNAGCARGDSADVQGPFVACQSTPQKGAARAVALLKLSLLTNQNLLHREREKEISLGSRNWVAVCLYEFG